MRKFSNRIAASFLAAAMLVSGPVSPLLANESGDTFVQLQEADTFSLQVAPSVYSAKLTWSGTDGKSVTIFRDGTQIGTTSESSYTDSAAAPGNHTYKISCDGSDSAAVSVTTGLSSALIHKDFFGEDRVFNGSRVVNLLEGKSADEIAAISALTKGSLIIQFKSSQPGPYTLFAGSGNGGYHASKDTGLVSDTSGKTMSVTVTNNNKIRTDYGKGFAGENGSVSANTWHTAVISLNDTTSQSWRVTIDGAHAFNLNSGQVVGFFSRLEGDLSKLLAGGAYDQNGNVIRGLNGEIAQIAVTDEFMTPEQAIALSNTPIPDDVVTPVDPDPDATVTLTATGCVSKAVLNWETNATGTAVIYRDDKQVASNVSGTTWTDSDVEDGEHTYKVVVNGTESEAKTINVGITSALIYKEFEGDARNFDGTKAVNLLEGASQDLINSLSSMTYGTMVLRFKDDGSTVPYMLMGAQTENSKYTGSWPEAKNPGGIISGYVTGNRKARFDIRGGDAVAESGSVSAETWHTIAFSNTDSTDKDQFKVYMDGSKVFSYNNSNLNLKDWFASMTDGKIRELYVGSLRSSDYSAADKTIVGGFKGKVDYAALIHEDLTDAELRAITATEQTVMNTIFDGHLGRTWVATGGGLGSSSMKQTGFNRTYSQIFSENISIDHTSYQTSDANYDHYYGSSRFYYPNRQRYVINTSFEGNTLETIDGDYERLVDKMTPYVVSLMLDGNESLSDETIKTHLKSILDKNYAARRASVIQIPPCKDTPARDLAPLVAEVVNALEDDQAAEVKVINHEKLFNDGSLKANAFNADGSLNAKGHLLVSNQMSTAFGLPSGSRTVSDSTIASKSYTRTAVLDAAPQVVVTANSVTVSTSESGSWNAAVAYNGQSISAELADGSAAFENLPENTDFVVTVTSDDGTRRLQKVTGTTGSATTGSFTEYPELSDLQKQITDKVNDKDKKLKWLFMGDSITHGIRTSGYDSVMQLFEHYVHEDLGRKDDIIINAGVSNADFVNLGHFFDQRYTPYKDADIVIMMLGTNDSAYSTTDERYVNYKSSTESFIDTCRSNNQIVILRNPPKIVQSSHANHGHRMAELARQLREVAASKNCLLADHHNLFEEKIYSDSTTGKGGQTWSADNIHPEGLGQLAMARQLIETMGLYDDDSEFFNTDYTSERTWSDDIKAAAPSLSADKATVTYPVSTLETQLSKTVGEFTIELSDLNHTVSKEVIRKEDASLGNVAVDTADLAGTVQVVVKAVPADTPKAGKIVYRGTIERETPQPPVTLDKSQLQLVHDAAKAADLDDYADTGKNELQDAVTLSETVLTSATTQQEINDMAAVLNSRWLAVRCKPSAERLGALH